MEEWKECKLKDIVEINPTESLKKGTVAKKIGMDVLQPYCRAIPSFSFEPYTGGTKFKNGDTIMARITPCLENGKTAMVNILDDNEIGFGSTEYIVFRAKNNITDIYFIYYLVTSDCIRNPAIKSMVGSSGRQRVQTDVVANLSINLPPLPIQQKIAAILSSLDDKIELNNKINTNLEQQIETLLLDYLSKKETTSVNLGDYLYIKGRIGWKGLKKNEYLSESKYRIINGETLTKSGIDWNKAGYISEERYTESPEIMLQAGDILLSKDGTIGKIGYVDELELPTSVASGIFVIRNNNPSEISTTFIYYLLKSKLFDSFIIARTEGSVIPHLYQKDFMDFEFPLPSPELMNKFEKTTQPMFNQIINNLKENKKLNSLRDLLLPKLMNGEII